MLYKLLYIVTIIYGPIVLKLTRIKVFYLVSKFFNQKVPRTILNALWCIRNEALHKYLQLLKIIE